MPQTIATEYLTQLLKTITQQKQTGFLRIEQVGGKTNEPGEIYFKNGRMMNARVGNERGKPALKRITEWTHVIYTFNRVGRSQSSAKPERSQQRGTDRPPSTSFQAGQPGRSSRPFLTAKLQREQAQATLATQKARQAPNSQPPEPNTLAMLKVSIAPSRTAQPLILRGDTLEEYISTLPPVPPHNNVRWTTHLNPETDQLSVPPVLAPNPHLGQQSDGEFLPGRLAIFKTKTVATTTQFMQCMERRERVIFVLLDGARTIQHIARLLHYSEAEVERILLTLMKRDLVEYVSG